MPPPSRLALQAAWCGARNGGRVSIVWPGGSPPASEWIAVSSSDSSRRQVGQEAGDPLGQGGLAGALGPAEHQVVAAGGGDLEGVAGVRHPGHVGEVEVLDALVARASVSSAALASGSTGGASGTASPRRCGDHLAQRAHPDHRHARDQRRLLGLRLGHDHAGRSRAPGRPSPSAAPPGTARSRPSRVSSPTNTTFSRAARRDLAGGRQHRDGDAPGRSAARAWAGRPATAGSSPAGSPASRSRCWSTAVRQRSRASLIDGVGPARPARWRPRRAPGRPVRRSGARSRPTARSSGPSRTPSADPAHVLEPRGRRARARARRPGRCGPRRDARRCSASHRAASRRSRAALRSVTASSGDAEAPWRPGLHLADDQHAGRRAAPGRSRRPRSASCGRAATMPRSTRWRAAYASP